MGLARRVTFGIAILSTIASGTLANAAPPKFKITAPNVIAFSNARAGQPYELDLRTLLEAAPSGPLAWSLTASPPWLRIDTANHRAYGDPAFADAGTASFKISVHENGQGESNRSAQITVLAPPKWSTERIDLGIANEGKTFALDLKQLVVDPVGGGVTFESRNLPSWLSLNGNTGQLTGVPRRPNVGAYGGIVFTARGVGGTAQAEAYGTVLKVVKPPVFVKKDFELPVAREDESYAQRISEFVLNEEPGARLTYDIVSQTPPPWLNIGKSSGTLSGTPGPDNIGPVAVSISLTSVIDGKSYTDTAQFRFRVDHVNHPPKWLADPIRLPVSYTMKVYRQDLSSSVTDPDVKTAKDKLTFSLRNVTGPGRANWLAIDPQTGLLGGTPAPQHVGQHSIAVVVTDAGGLAASTTVLVEVKKSNEPPYWTQKPGFLRSAKEDHAYDVDLTELVVDPDNDPLTFTGISLPSWLQLTSTGKLLGRPRKDDVGTVTLLVRVADNISGGDTVELRLLVEPTNHAPYWVLKPIQLSTKQEAMMDLDISVYAKDDDNDEVLAFSVLEGPPWAQLSARGRFTGKPGIGTAGANRYRVRVADRAGSGADVDLIINVEAVNHAPVWLVDPVELATAKEGSEYAGSLAEHVRDVDTNDRLSFTKLSGPQWALVNSDGRVAGTPGRRDVGITELRVRVMDSSSEFSIATVRIPVEKTNRPPRWRQNPIQIPDSGVDSAFSFDLKQFAADDDGDALAFRLVNGPRWMSVTETGMVGGVPSTADAGPYVAVFEVRDGQGASNPGNSAQAQGRGEITRLNRAPVVSATLPTFEVAERKVVPLNFNDPRFVSDPDGDTLHFTPVTAVPWITMTGAGVITFSPKHEHVGTHAYAIRIDDGKVAVTASLRILVKAEAVAPLWLENPVELDARVNQKLVASIATKAKDVDGNPLTFAKKGGAAWLTVDAQGNVTGQPSASDVGTGTFTVDACNAALCTEGRLLVTVSGSTTTPTVDVVVLDAPVEEGMRAEILWLVDSSSNSDHLVRQLKAGSEELYLRLASRRVRMEEMMISTDVPKWDGTPIRGQGESMVFRGTYPAQVLSRRLDQAKSTDSCGNCFNSPIWALHRFLQKASTYSEVYRKNFFKEGIALDAIILTAQREHYPAFSRHEPETKNYTTAHFAQAFTEKLLASSQAIRVHSIVAACPTLLETSGEPASSAPAEAYRQLSEATYGKYAVSCGTSVKTGLAEIGEQISFRAALFAKRRVSLSKTPADPSNIRVSVGGTAVVGNTGREGEAWSYDRDKGDLLLRWERIDTGQLKSGQELRIEYETE